MIAGFLDVVAGVWAWLGRILSAIGRWLRAEHDWWRIGFFAMGVVAMIASCAVWDRQNALTTAIALRAADADTCKATITGLKAVLAGHDAAETALASAARAESRRIAEAQEQNAQALADVAKAQEVANRNNAAWWTDYAKRPPTCAQAQQALDVACAGIKDY